MRFSPAPRRSARPTRRQTEASGPLRESTLPFYRPRRPEPVFFRALGDTIDIVVIGLAVVLVTVMFVNVLSRGILDVDLAWNVEFGEFVLVWAVFLGGAAAARRGAHMRIGEAVTAMPARARRIVEVSTRLGVLLLLGYLVWKGAIIAWSQMDQKMSVLYWPVGLQYLALPVGALLIGIFVAYETFRILRGDSAFDLAPPR